MVPPQWLLLYKVVVEIWPVVICRMFKEASAHNKYSVNVDLMFIAINSKGKDLGILWRTIDIQTVR